MAAESNCSNLWSDKLLELNRKQNLTYSEVYDIIADMDIYCKVGKEEVNRLKTDIEKKETEYEYKLLIRDTMCQFDEELDNSRKRTEELIKIKKCNVELRNEIYDLKKQKMLEREKQQKIMDKRWNEVYKKSMKMIENDPSVIKRNQLRNKNAKLKFQIAFIKQKIEKIEKSYAQFKKIEKQIEQRKIIQFAEAMVKYYKKQKEMNEINISEQNKIKELNLSSVTTENIDGNITSKQLNWNSPINRSQNDFKQKTLPLPKTSSKMSIMESFKLNIKSIQLSSLSLLNNKFDPKNYINMNYLTASKPEIQKETPKQVVSNINIPKPNFNFTTLSKFDFNITKSAKPVEDKKLLKQNNQKQELKRSLQTEEPKPKRKVPPVLKNNLQELNSEAEKEERIFLSQQENKNSSQSDTVISSSQDSKKNTSSKLNQNLSQSIPNNVEKVTKINQNNNKAIQQNQVINPRPAFNTENILNKSQIFNFPTNISTKSIINETQKPSSLGQMFNLPPISKNIENVPQKPNSGEFLQQTYCQNKVFNVPVGTPKRVENTSEAPHFSNAPKPMETKSPYFPNQSSQNDQSSLNTSAENSDQVVNVSSDQHPSQISGDEYFDASANMQIQEEIQPHMIEYNNADPNMMEYYGSNPSLQDIGEQAVSPYSFSGFKSPEFTNEENLEVNQQINTTIPANNNPFSANQNGNNFFNFGQSNNSKSNNIFNLF